MLLGARNFIFDVKTEIPSHFGSLIATAQLFA
jgi:hypothetical protein